MTADYIIDHGMFRDTLRQNIVDLKTERRNRPQPKPGFKYRRDWYDRHGNDLTFDYCIKHIPDIVAKRSSIPSEFRRIIEYLFAKSYRETFANRPEEIYRK